MKNNLKEFFNTFFLVIGYVVFFFILQGFLYKAGLFKAFPENESLLTLDAAWYRSIADVGYKYWEAANNTGFYFLFPLIWKLTHLDALGISCLNAVFFAVGFATFVGIYKLSAADKLVYLTIPSFLFMFVPYAESLFFLLAIICLYGILHDKKLLTGICLFLIALTRANAAVLFPVFLIAEMITTDRNRWFRSAVASFLKYGLPLLLGLIVFILYQYYETGIWLAYFKTQALYWGRQFAVPTFPLHSVLGPKVLWLNALSLFIGMFSMLVVIYKGFSWLVKNKIQQDKLTIISELYLAASALLIVLFNPVYGTYTTNVYGAHRYGLANPFIMIFLYHYTQRSYKVWNYIVIALLGNLFFLLFASYEHIGFILYYNFSLLLVLLYMSYANKKLSWPVVAVTAINFVLQVILFQEFLNKEFID